MKTKVFAAYLPQFHENEVNNEFWGKGYTDWMGVKNAKPQFLNHKQPKMPFNNNYYDLSNVKTIRWQAELAHKYGVNGFNIYHYWFKNGQQALTKPAELLLEHKEIDICYFFSWDNCSWVRSWSNIPGNSWAPNMDSNISKDGKIVLLEFEYGKEEQWKKHFYYLLPFFKDSRYLTIDEKPVFAIMNNDNINTLNLMGEYWNELAKEEGLKGVYLISRKDEFRNKHLFDNQFLYEPPASSWGKRMSIEGKLQKYFGLNLKKDGSVKYLYDYDKYWKRLIHNAKKHIKDKLIVGAAIAFDDTPRRGENARILFGSSPEKFEKYFSCLYTMCCEANCEIMLLTAWNEWGEGAYLEPDEENGYAYLEALKRAIDSVKE